MCHVCSLQVCDRIDLFILIHDQNDCWQWFCGANNFHPFIKCYTIKPYSYTAQWALMSAKVVGKCLLQTFAFGWGKKAQISGKLLLKNKKTTANQKRTHNKIRANQLLYASSWLIRTISRRNCFITSHFNPKKSKMVTLWHILHLVYIIAATTQHSSNNNKNRNKKKNICWITFPSSRRRRRSRRRKNNTTHTENDLILKMTLDTRQTWNEHTFTNFITYTKCIHGKNPSIDGIRAIWDTILSIDFKYGEYRGLFSNQSIHPSLLPCGTCKKPQNSR